jgi:2-polyprenyl-3-methyl-5-hydroxy-6-metoxy-1,4-benzoquinol methylase
MLNEERLQNYLHKMVGDLGAAASGSLVVTGDRLGLYKAIAENGPVTASELAENTVTNERYVREWLSTQAASGYVDYDAQSNKFSMNPEQQAVFADENSPYFMTGGYYSIAAMYTDEPMLTAAFTTGEGIGWGEHHGCLFCGAAKFFRPSYQANLVSSWIPSLEGDVVEKLKKGAKVADVGCGHGISTAIMAQAFPNSTFVGYDFHESSIEDARKNATNAGVTNVTFEVATAKDFPGEGYDLVTFFDCLHDMGDPAGAAAHVRQSLAEDGTWMIVEPAAGDLLADNINPVGRVYYAFSTAICTPSSLSQEVGTALGAQAGEARLREVVSAGGFGSVRRASETPFNIVLEARP